MIKKGIWEEKTPYQKLLILTGLVVVCIMVLTFIATVLIQPLFGLNVFSSPGTMSDLNNESVISAMKFLQVFNAIGMFVLPPLLLAYFCSQNTTSFLSMNKIPNGSLFILSALGMLISLPIISVLADLNNHLKLPPILSGLEEWMKASEQQAAIVTEKFLDIKSIGGLIFTLFMVALLPAFGEELLFRGSIQNLLNQQSKNIHLAIILSAAIFSALHMQFYGFLPRMMMGIWFGYLMYWSGSIWLPVTAHLTNNGAAVLMTYFNPESAKNLESADNIDSIYVVLSVVVFGAITFLIRKRSLGDNR